MQIVINPILFWCSWTYIWNSASSLTIMREVAVWMILKIANVILLGSTEVSNLIQLPQWKSHFIDIQFQIRLDVKILANSHQVYWLLRVSQNFDLSIFWLPFKVDKMFYIVFKYAVSVDCKVSYNFSPRHVISLDTQ